jgi:hypothetical protein
VKKIIFLLVIIAFGSCSKKEDSSPASLDINYSQWYLTRTNYGGGLVHLKIDGSTNSDKVTIRTFGDGVVTDENVELDSRKNFTKDVVISFTATSIPSGEFESSTIVKAYKSTDILTISLKSGKLKY